ncbi:MAG: TolC family protein [Mariniphaga sp.]|nr:TolC family protein [Mariniphaga sp.]
MNRISAIVFFITTIPILVGSRLYAQTTFSELFEQAKKNSPDMVILEASRNYLLLETSKIKAENTSPKTFISSEVLFAPYFNNNGKIISTDPKKAAIGYDIGVTNGGLYALLLNTEMPVLNHKQVSNLLEQNNLEIAKTDTRIKTVAIELKHSLSLQYLDVLTSQAEYQSLQENLHLLKQQLEIIKTLTDHGLYRYVDFRLIQTACMTDSINFENAKSTYQLKLDQLLASSGISDTEITEIAFYEPRFNNKNTDTSFFLQPYTQDSLSAVIQERVFENQYKPQVKIYANTGLNSTSIPHWGNHVGMSAGIQLTYTLFDGKQKQINRKQQLILMQQATKEKKIKQFELQKQKISYSNAIQAVNKSIEKEEKLQNEYNDILAIFNKELQNGQIGIIDYLNFIQQFNQNKLSLVNHKIERSKLIVEYNYWNN